MNEHRVWIAVFKVFLKQLQCYFCLSAPLCLRGLFWYFLRTSNMSSHKTSKMLCSWVLGITGDIMLCCVAGVEIIGNLMQIELSIGSSPMPFRKSGVLTQVDFFVLSVVAPHKLAVSWNCDQSFIISYCQFLLSVEYFFLLQMW